MEAILDIIKILGPFTTLPDVEGHVRRAAAENIEICMELLKKQLEEWVRKTSDIKIVQKF